MKFKKVKAVSQPELVPNAESLLGGLDEYTDLHNGIGSENFDMFLVYAFDNFNFDGENYEEFYNSLINFTGVEVAYTLFMQRPLFTMTQNADGESVLIRNNDTLLNNRYVEFLDGKFEGWSARVVYVTDRLEEIRYRKPVTNHEKFVYMNRAFVDDLLWDFTDKRFSIIENWGLANQVYVSDYLEYLGYIAGVLEEEDLEIGESHYNDLHYFYKFLKENTGINYPINLES